MIKLRSRSILFIVALSAALLLPLFSIGSSVSPAVELENRPTLFSRPLRLTDVSVPNNSQYRRSDYLFTIEIPAAAEQPLQTVVFAQVEGADYPRYSARRSRAYAQSIEEGDRREALNITATNSTDDRTVTVEFDPPVQPGHQITIALNSRNPRDGIYIYEVTGSPPDVTGPGQRIGIGRLQFYQREDRQYRGFL
ncbi:MAG: DUF2808 domain-containing protein [Phormidesmis sp.]